MITIIRVVVLALTAVISTVNAQDFQGVATYKTQRQVDIKIDSAKMDAGMHAQIVEMMKKQFQKTFKLTFNKEESVYKQDEELSKPQVGGGEFQVVMIGAGGGTDVLYKNTKEQRFSQQVDTYGKIFLVKDNIEKIDCFLPRNKLDVYTGGDRETIEEKVTCKTKYSRTKRLSIEYTKKMIQSQPKWLEKLMNSKKKDDLADSFIQGACYLARFSK